MLALKNGLYVVATPIGNMGDISSRALEVFKLVDKIVCEDTRVTKKLLSRNNIKSKTTSYHDHNANTVRPTLIKEMLNGSAMALVSDAGMPTISDPGYKLVRDCIKAELFVTVIPGPTAGLSGLVLSGLPTNRFLFVGYLPSKSEQRKRTLREISSLSASLIFYETANRLNSVLRDMKDIFGDRPAAVLRELTKLHEEARRGSLNTLSTFYRENSKPRGEIIIVVGPAEDIEFVSDEEVAEILRVRLKTLTLKDTVFEVAKITGRPRKEVYKIAIGLKPI